jgi:hypothetical protein
MLLALIPAALVYFGLVVLLSRWLCPHPEHRGSHLRAAGVGLALGIVIGMFGVPYVSNAQDRVGFPLALVVITLGPVVLPRLGQRSRIAVGIVLAVAFGEPVVRVEYLTWRYGPVLHEAFERVEGEAGGERLFSVLSYSRKRAAVVRVSKDKEAHWLRFEADGDDSWRVVPASYPPQQLLWYYGNSGWYDCPYPTSVLLVLHGAGAWCD